jgi:hypothetical protein
MDVRINEVQSQVQTLDSKAMLDPQVMRQIVKACVKAVKEDQERQKRLADDRRLSSGVSSENE